MILGHVDAKNQPVRHGFICACGKIGVRELKHLVEHHKMEHPEPIGAGVDRTITPQELRATARRSTDRVLPTRTRVQ